MKYLSIAALAAAGFLAVSSANATPASIDAGSVAQSSKSDVQNVWWHGGWHNRWRSHHRWGSHGGWHNRWRSHHRWGSHRY